MNGSDSVEYTKAVDGPPEDALTVPLKSMSKREIDSRTELWLMEMLEVYSAADLFVYVRQMEETAEYLKGKLKIMAFDSIATTLDGSMTGKILGHDVKLTMPKKWIYSQAVADLVEQQKRDLKALQAKEQADGTAFQQREDGRITVTIKEE